MNHKSPVTALTNLEFIAEGRLNLLTLVIVAFLENATIGYLLESLCVCVCVRPCLYVCVFLHDNSKKIDLGTRNRNTL